jgi:hypothetical protein
MRPSILACIAALSVVGGCSPDSEAQGDEGAISIPSTADCQDAREWQQQSVVARTQKAEDPSDQAQILRLGRANFLAGMAIVADLRCLSADREVDQRIDAALEAAHEATRARSFYEQAILWGRANEAANQAIQQLVRRVAERT